MAEVEKWTVHPTDDPTLKIEVTVMLDTGNIADDTGYDRFAIIRDWNPWATDQMAQLHYRVDQHPGASFAKAEVWHTNLGWLSQGSIPVAEFWSWMPGFERALTDRAERSGRTLLKDLAGIMYNIAVEQDKAVTQKMDDWVDKTSGPI